MKVLFLLLALSTFRSYAASSTDCYLIKGGSLPNSHTEIENFKFVTVVDVFTLRNANTLSFDLESTAIRLTRTSIDVSDETRMTFIQKKNNQAIRAVNLVIDRTPREVVLDKEFYVGVTISPELTVDADYTSIIGVEPLNYNFYCSF